MSEGTNVNGFQEHVQVDPNQSKADELRKQFDPNYKAATAAPSEPESPRLSSESEEKEVIEAVPKVLSKEANDLLNGRFKTKEAEEKSYKELQRAFHKQQAELNEIKKGLASSVDENLSSESVSPTVEETHRNHNLVERLTNSVLSGVDFSEDETISLSALGIGETDHAWLKEIIQNRADSVQKEIASVVSTDIETLQKFAADHYDNEILQGFNTLIGKGKVKQVMQVIESDYLATNPTAEPASETHSNPLMRQGVIPTNSAGSGYSSSKEITDGMKSVKNNYNYNSAEVKDHERRLQKTSQSILDQWRKEMYS